MKDTKRSVDECAGEDKRSLRGSPKTPFVCPLILLRPYQCSQSRIIEMLRQGVRGSDLFRVIFSSGIPMPFWLK